MLKTKADFVMYLFIIFTPFVFIQILIVKEIMP